MSLITHYHLTPNIVHILVGRPIGMRIRPNIGGKIVVCNEGLLEITSRLAVGKMATAEIHLFVWSHCELISVYVPCLPYETVDWYLPLNVSIYLADYLGSLVWSIDRSWVTIHSNYTLSEACCGVNWADLMAAQGAFGTDIYDRSILRPNHRAYYRSGRPVIKIGPKGAPGSLEIRPIQSAPSLGQSIPSNPLFCYPILVFVFMTLKWIWPLSFVFVMTQVLCQICSTVRWLQPSLCITLVVCGQEASSYTSRVGDNSRDSSPPYLLLCGHSNDREVCLLD